MNDTVIQTSTMSAMSRLVIVMFLPSSSGR